MEDNVISHPSHYTSSFEPVPPECIRVAELMMFRPGNAFKYVWRAGLKEGEMGRLRDLEKALQYLSFINDADYTLEEELNNKKAHIAFNAIKDDGSWKYFVLKSIVRCHYFVAEGAIKKEIDRLKNVKN